MQRQTRDTLTRSPPPISVSSIPTLPRRRKAENHKPPPRLMRLLQTSAFQADSASAWSIPYNLIGDKLSSTYVWPAETNPGDSAHAYVTVNKKTRIFLRRGGLYERVEFDE